jgi:hypothetical protein
MPSLSAITSKRSIRENIVIVLRISYNYFDHINLTHTGK